MFTLLSKDIDLCWTLQCQEAFEIIKKKLITTPILQCPNWNLYFHIHTDAFDKAIGAILG